jgi:tetratricopeptide (TPR) repeat protein
MPRLYLAFLFFWTWPCTSYSQVKIRDVIEFADKQFKKGDYYYATQMYDKALQMDSTSIELFWKQAESYRAYKNYELAAQWYAKVYAVDAEKSYPSALMYYALMTKQMGNYTAALALFKKAYKEVSDAPDDYLYKKTKQEIKSTEYAIKTQQKKGITINPFSTEINSYDAEFGHLYKNGVFYFSSLKADSINTKEEVYSTFYRTNTYRANNQGQTFTPPTVWKDLIVSDKSTGNGSFDSQGWYYYSLCEDKGFSYRCKIVRYKEGVGVDTLNEIINQPGSNTTHPSWAKLKNGKTYLFFSSDREGGNGGMDLWYAAIQSDGSFDEPKNISSLNSMENEITPWFDSDSSRLFF